MAARPRYVVNNSDTDAANRNLAFIAGRLASDINLKHPGLVATVSNVDGLVKLRVADRLPGAGGVANDPFSFSVRVPFVVLLARMARVTVESGSVSLPSTPGAEIVSVPSSATV